MDIAAHCPKILSEDNGLVLYRQASGHGAARHLVRTSVAETTSERQLDYLRHELAVASGFDDDWAVRPQHLATEGERWLLCLQDFDGSALDPTKTSRLAMPRALRLAVAMSEAVGRLHARGIVHKDLRPSQFLRDDRDGVRLSGFGRASREAIEGPLLTEKPPSTAAYAYMSPEMTGRMNRSIDKRSDLYSLGIALYEILNGYLPFVASEPAEWIDCHVARAPMPARRGATPLPAAVTDILLKLMAKAPEQRYQTAASLTLDLKRCLADLSTHGRIDPFEPGAHDTPERLYIPEKLYGRRAAIARLLAAYDEVADRGATELVLVAGASGVGKSAVVRELHRQMIVSGGLFASGKCDRSASDIPYGTLARALGRFLGEIAERGEGAIGFWRQRLGDALGPNGQVLAALIPELELIIGRQRPAPPLAAVEAKYRFDLVFRRFVGALAGASHPFALFIDDLQWIDAATLDLLAGVVTDPEIRYFLLLGAYRSNEVNAAHPLSATIQKIAATGTRIHDIDLAPLAVGDIETMLTDCLRARRNDVVALAALVHRLTAGNPFLSKQLMTALAESGSLVFDRDRGCWSWDVEAIGAAYTAQTMSRLITDRLARAPAAAATILRTLACLGNRCDVQTLGIIHQLSESEVHAAVAEIVRTGLVQSDGPQLAFLHDRVQEAAYALIPADARAAAHLAIGRALAAGFNGVELQERIFEVVNQLNRGTELITTAEERLMVARLNLVAAKTAKTSTAHSSFHSYLTAGRALLPADAWTTTPQLVFEFEFNLCESQFLLGHLQEAERGLKALSLHAVSLADRSLVVWLQITLFTAKGELGRAVEICLEFLARVGIHWDPHPTRDAVLVEYAPIRDEIERGEIGARLGLPPIQEPIHRITLDVLTAVLPPAFFTDQNLVSLVLCRMATISKRYGNSDSSSLGYAYLGMILGPTFDAWAAGYSFGQLGFQLATEIAHNRFIARVQMTFAYHVMPYSIHVTRSLALLRDAFAVANDRGDLTYAGFSSCTLVSSMLLAGAPLDELQRVAEQRLQFVAGAKFGLIVVIITTQLQLIRSLRGLTAAFPSLNDDAFDEAGYETYLDDNPQLAIATCWYWIRKLQTRLLGGAFAEAVEAAVKAEPLMWTTGGHLELVEYHFYAGLARAGLCSADDDAAIAAQLPPLRAHAAALRVLAAQCPDNFAHRSMLLQAEIARIEQQPFDALRLYEAAISSARSHGFMQIEALAAEMAARLCVTKGLDSAAQGYATSAIELYRSYGAAAKVRQLQAAAAAATPGCSARRPDRDGDRIGADMAALLQTSLAMAEEVGSDKLLGTLMTIVLQNSGATRGLLILPHGDELRLETEAVRSAEAIEVHVRRVALQDDHAPYSIIRQVVATRLAFLLDSSAAAEDVANDRYFAEQKPRSLVCLPLVKQGRLLGVLYLENTLTPHAFTATRLDVLTLLASQVAISLENATLAEKESLLKEVHHRVKNNLQLITSLLNLQAARATDPAVSELLEDSRNRLRSMALVHENLYRAGNLARISMGTHIQSLCAQLFRSYRTHQQRVNLATRIDDIQLDLDRAVSCGLVVNELVSNALRHGFPDDSQGTITVALTAGGDRHLELSVEDDGIGLGDGGVSKYSLGLELVEDLTQQLRGSLSVSSANGTRFAIRFPLTEDEVGAPA